MVLHRKWFKKAREIKGMTQESVAQKVGVTRQHVGLIETGVTDPSPRVAKLLGELLGSDWTLFFENIATEKTGTDN